MLGPYLVLCFLCYLHGNEGFMVELDGVIKHIYDRKRGLVEHLHVVIPLLGRFKTLRWYEVVFHVGNF